MRKPCDTSEAEDVTIKHYTPTTEMEKMLSKSLNFVTKEASRYRELSEKQAAEVDGLKKQLLIAEGLLFKITHNELCHCAVDGENCYIEQAKDYLAAREKL